jgi:hypothetical protein
MLVTAITGTVVSVVRGVNGTQANAHGITAPVVAGLPTDFPNFAPAQGVMLDMQPNGFVGFSAPVVSANTITPTGPFFHMTGTTIVKTINLPSNFVEGGWIAIVFDGSSAGLTWDATGNIAVAGTATTAGSVVSFFFDKGSGKWHPSRLA